MNNIHFDRFQYIYFIFFCAAEWERNEGENSLDPK